MPRRLGYLLPCCRGVKYSFSCIVLQVVLRGLLWACQVGRRLDRTRYTNDRGPEWYIPVRSLIQESRVRVHLITIQCFFYFCKYAVAYLVTGSCPNFFYPLAKNHVYSRSRDSICAMDAFQKTSKPKKTFKSCLVRKILKTHE